jgi:NitT/TauT family transport system substrate-binding protein
MKVPAILRGPAFLFILVLVLAACQAENGASPTEEPPESEPASTSSAPAESEPAESEPAEAEGTTEFTVAFTTPGVSSVPLLEAIERLNADGYTIEAPTVGSSELAVDGVCRGEFAFSSGATNAVLLADQAGCDIKVVGNRVDNEWTVYAATDITECADLDGRRLAIHSEGAVSTAMVRNYIETNCPGTEPEYLIIEGSQNRLAALLADEIDASPLELADAIIVDEQAADRYALLASLAQQLPELKPTAVYANGEFISANPGSVQALLQAQVEVHRDIAEDPALFRDLILKHLPETDEATLDIVVDQYLELELLGVNGGMDEAGIEYTLNFFNDALDDLDGSLTVEDVSDLSHLEAVLDEIGRE